MKLKIEYLPVEALKPYKNNARKHGEEDIDAICESIKEFGFDDPIGIWKDTIVEGHGRLMAAKKLGMTEVPVIRLDHLTDEQRRAYALAHNRTAEMSIWDDPAKALELMDISLDLSWLRFEDEPKEQNDGTPKPNLKEMELKAFEHYDYLVFVFRDTRDWLNACTYFDIQKVNSGYGKVKKIGVGRVVDGTRLLKAIGYQASDNQQIEV